MKIFLDDERLTPEGWTRVYWPDEAIELLQTKTVTEISLDHDLGNDAKGTGYDVIVWIEQAVVISGFPPCYSDSQRQSSGARTNGGRRSIHYSTAKTQLTP